MPTSITEAGRFDEASVALREAASTAQASGEAGFIDRVELGQGGGASS